MNPVLNHGAQRELIFLAAEDRQRFVATQGEACVKTRWPAGGCSKQRTAPFPVRVPTLREKTASNPVPRAERERP